MAKTWVKTSNTLPRYRFKLVSPDGELILKNSPLEWESATLELERRIDVGGVFVNYTGSDSLTFIKDGYDFIKKLFNTYELNATCDLYVYELNYETRQYEQFPVVFSLNFNFYKLVKMPNTNVKAGVSIKAVNSSELVKFDNRKGVDVDLSKLTLNAQNKLVAISVGGYEIVDWDDEDATYYTGLKKDINSPNVTIEYTGIARVPTTTDQYDIAKVQNSNSFTAIPANVLSSDFGEDLKPVPYATQKTNLADISPVFEASFDYDFTVSWQVIINVRDKDSNPPYTVKLIEVDESGVIVNTYINQQFGTEKAVLRFNGTFTASIPTGHSFKYVIEVKDIDDIRAYIWDDLETRPERGRVVFEYTQIKFVQSVASSQAKKTESLPIYEAIERNLQLILDKQFPFYSEYLGRQDTAYNFAGSTYLTEDQTRFLNLMSGLNLRGALLSNDDAPISSNFEKLFKAVNSVYNLGYTFQQIEGFNRLRIENYSYFFDDEIILDLSDRINDLDIESEVMPELAYLDIKSGYKKFEYEQVNGRGEFNTTNQRTSIINTDTEFDNISDVRADTRGIINLLSSSIGENGTKDEKGDNELFFIKTQRDEDAWKPEKEENMRIEDDSSIFGENTFNLFISPTWNLLRHGNKLKASLIKYTASKLRFQVSDKLQTLETTRISDGYNVKENDDILVDDLDDPIWKPISHTVEVELTFSERSALINNSLKRIKFTDSLSGWMLRYTHKNNEDKVSITIIEKYVS